MTDLPRSSRQHISVQKIGREMLVYDERRHMAFCLNQTSSVIWELASGERTLDELVTIVSAALNTPLSRELVALAVAELREQELIEAAHVSNSEAPVSRRDLLVKLGVASAALLPAVASIVAPTAAQAYSGCVDCSIAPGRPGPLIRRGPAPSNPSQ